MVYLLLSLVILCNLGNLRQALGCCARGHDMTASTSNLDKFDQNLSTAISQ
jgi:hypothetical protein